MTASDDGSTTTQGLVEKTGADPVFLSQLDHPSMLLIQYLLTNKGRILLYLASERIIKQIDDNRWGSTNITKSLSIEGIKAGIDFK